MLTLTGVEFIDLDGIVLPLNGITRLHFKKHQFPTAGHAKTVEISCSNEKYKFHDEDCDQIRQFLDDHRHIETGIGVAK